MASGMNHVQLAIWRAGQSMFGSPYDERDDHIQPAIWRAGRRVQLAIWRVGQYMSGSPYGKRDGPRQACHMATQKIQYGSLQRPASFLRVSIELSLVSSRL
ncbi:hypothetical protein F2Q70_00039361 [Brassica cretica]|uniref:Uncharacterized protein n=1 Tax=Brassica cretica TaxID=69181 RepID=A0A8S9K6A8_BRACR|nr:hypothetical protein F2Q70_00039361 [Brassica cretica]